MSLIIFKGRSFIFFFKCHFNVNLISRKEIETVIGDSVVSNTISNILV